MFCSPQIITTDLSKLVCDVYISPLRSLQCRPLARHKKKRSRKASLRYSEPGSNRYGHYCPQDFKSGVSTYSTIRATWSSKRRRKCTTFNLKFQNFLRYTTNHCHIRGCCWCCCRTPQWLGESRDEGHEVLHFCVLPACRSCVSAQI